MANYSNVKGFTVQTLASDTIPSQFGGGAWSSGPTMNTARASGMSGGPSTSAIVMGGSDPSDDYTATSETFNGTAWSSAPNLNEGRSEGGGFATSSEAALMSGGYTTDSPAGVRATTETFDGSSWTEVADMNVGRTSQPGTSWGTLTAGSEVAGVGNTSPGVNTTLQEYWNGSAWSEQGDLNLGRRDAGGAGVQTAGLVGAGMSGSPYPGTITNNTESWDGSSWTEVAEMNDALRAFGGSFGTSTEAIFAGGQPPETTNTEHWNGSAWTEVANMSTARSGGTGFGTATDGYAYGDNGKSTAGERFEAPSTFVQIEEGQLFFNSTTNTFKVTQAYVPGGTWASGGNMNEPRTNLLGQGAGNKTAALVWGGKQAPPAILTKTESYNGSSWTEVNDLNAARSYSGGAGTQTAALAIGNTSAPKSANESWNGTSWTEVNDLNTGRSYAMWSGIQTSALAGAGYTTTMVNNTETWDGTSWTEASEVNEARDGVACAGQSNTAGLIAGGYHTTSPPTNTANTEIWNGSSWTEVNNLNVKTRAGTGGGTTTAAFCAGGANDPPSGPPWQVTTANTEYFDGTSWTELNDLSSAVQEQCGRGGTTAAFSAGGSPSPTGLNTMEIWTAAEANNTITAT